MERFASPGGLNKNDLLFQQLYTSIRDGKLPHGTRLASENELAEQHSCSRITVRKSLRRLEELNLIRRIRGNGTYVSSRGARFNDRRNIALVACDAGIPGYNEVDPYLNSLMLALFRYCGNFGFSANFIVLRRDGETFMESFERQGIDADGFDGFIFAKQLTTREGAALEEGGHCYVALQPPEKEVKASYATIDNYGGVYALTRHMLERGRRNLVFLHGPLNEAINREKLKGFFQALDEFQLTAPLQRRHYEVRYQRDDDSAETVERLLAERQTFDTLLIQGDLATVGAVQVLRNHQLRIPDDVAVGMYDDYALVRYILKMGITAISQPIAEQIHAALEMLSLRLARPDAPHTIQKIQPLLLIRESSPMISLSRL